MSLKPSCYLSIVIKREGRIIGFSFVDKNEIQACEFNDDSGYSNLESLLLQLKPDEGIVFLSGEISMEAMKIEKLFGRCDVKIVMGELKEFVISESIEKLIEEGNSLNEYRNAIFESISLRQSLSCLDRNLEKTSFKGTLSFSRLAPHSFLRLDKAAFSALNLMPQMGDGLTRPTSLFGFLNRCKTKFGAERLATWIRQPSVDYDDIQQRLSIVDILVKNPFLRQALQRDHLRLLPNLEALALKMRRGVSKPSPSLLQSILDIHKGLIECHGILAVLDTLKDREGEDSINIKTLNSRLQTPLRLALAKMKRFHELVEYSLNAAEAKQGRAEIDKGFDEKLQALALKREQWTRRAEYHRRAVEEDLGLTRTKSPETRAVRMVECSVNVFLFRVTKNDQKAVQSSKKGRYRQVKVNKAEFLFSTSELSDLASEWTELSEKYKKQQNDLAIKTVAAAVTYWPVLDTITDIVGQIDILTAFAVVASEAITPLQKPLILPNSAPRRLFLKQCRHPLMEIQMQISHLGKQVIPNDALLEQEVSRLQIITGPNMGGKSTYIRQIALVCVMAQIGSFVPCALAELSLVDSISCRVGASDDQLRGMSTFLSEMSEASSILSASTSRSLILIDELGRGTSISEGFGLAWEIAKTILSDLKCFCLFATHFHELSNLAQIEKGAINKRVTVHFDNEGSLAFLYGVEDGFADQSYGIQIAELAGMDPRVVDLAKRQVKALEMKQSETKITSQSLEEEVCLRKSQATFLTERLLNALGIQNILNLTTEQFRENCCNNLKALENDFKDICSAIA